METGPDPANKNDERAAAKPELLDYVAIKIEQSYIQLGISIAGVMVAALLAVLGAVTGIRALVFIAPILVFVALAVGLFFGHDVNYRVRRIRERAAERESEARGK